MVDGGFFNDDLEEIIEGILEGIELYHNTKDDEDDEDEEEEEEE
jgi:hypothetical protein